MMTKASVKSSGESWGEKPNRDRATSAKDGVDYNADSEEVTAV